MTWAWVLFVSWLLMAMELLCIGFAMLSEKAKPGRARAAICCAIGLASLAASDHFTKLEKLRAKAAAKTAEVTD